MIILRDKNFGNKSENSEPTLESQKPPVYNSGMSLNTPEEDARTFVTQADQTISKLK